MGHNFFVKAWFIGLSLLLAPLPAVAAELPAGFEEATFAAGLSSPTALEFAPDGRLFVTEKAGNLRVIKNGQLLSTPFLSVVVATNSERGLLGVAFDPNFANNGYVYVYYTRATAPIKNRISRFKVSANNPDLADLSSEVVILDDIASDAGNHNGGAIHFGLDGKLYVGIGDGGANAANGQSLSTLSGKLLRIDPSAYPNIVPPDNPFVTTSGARGEIWAYGLRNPFTFAVQPGTGSLFINDVGQDTWEEVNRGTVGVNYGWPLSEGPTSDPAFTGPLYAYNHNGGSASIAGGAFYQGSQFPAEYTNNYFFGDYVLGFIRRLLPGDYSQASDFATGVLGPVDLKVGSDSSLYYASIFTGNIYKISYIGDANRNPIASLKAIPSAGSAPLTVRFNGLASSDPDRDPLTYQWNFGDGSPTATGGITAHVYRAGQYTASLSVNDGKGGTNVATTKITSGSNPPVPQIALPEQTRYTAGSTIQFSGTATDTEDGTLPASAYSWLVVFHHDTHTHPFFGPLTGVTQGSFVIPTTGETAADVFYRIELTVTDASGLMTTTSRDIEPRRSVITLTTTPPGLELTLDGQPVTGRESVMSVVGLTRTLGAPATQQVGSTIYEFVGWSDGGAATHTINTPATATTYTATYQRR